MKAVAHRFEGDRVPKSAALFALIEGILLVLFGLAAICFPALAGIATAVLFGWILIASGLAGLVGTVAGRGYGHFWWSLLSSMLAVIAGVLMAFHPFAAAMDTRECRRAALDALPLLKKADHVAVCEIASEDGMAAAQTHLADVVGWLKRDGITAGPIAALSTAGDATQLDAIANEQSADVIVAGAYGHSRLRE